jgi:hypothetical protein
MSRKANIFWNSTPYSLTDDYQRIGIIFWLLFTLHVVARRRGHPPNWTLHPRGHYPSSISPIRCRLKGLWLFLCMVRRWRQVMFPPHPVFWDIKPSCVVKWVQRYKETYCLCLRGRQRRQQIPLEHEYQYLPIKVHDFTPYKTQIPLITILSWSTVSKLISLTWITFVEKRLVLFILEIISPRQPVDVLLARPIQMAQQCLLASSMTFVVPRMQPVLVWPAWSIGKVIDRVRPMRQRSGLMFSVIRVTMSG